MMKALVLGAVLTIPNVASATPCSELMPTVYKHATIIEKKTVFTVTTFIENIRPSLADCYHSEEYAWSNEFTSALSGAIQSADATLAIGKDYKNMILQFGGDSALAIYEEKGADFAVGWLFAAADEQDFIRRLEMEFQGNFADHMKVVEIFLTQ